MQDTDTHTRIGTSTKILEIAREILTSKGLAAVSFDAIARRLGRSKQAVLYWYPTKRALLAAMFLPWLEAETETAEAAVLGAENRAGAIDAFVRAVASFHLGNPDRFRMMYLVPQTIGPNANGGAKLIAGNEIYPVTDRLYGALAEHLGGGEEAARREAVAIHSAVLGLVLMLALTDALGDPLKHTGADLIDALTASLTGKN